LKFCKEKGSSFEQTCFGTSTTSHSSKVVKCKSHLINETKTFHQKNNTQKKKSPNKPMITIAMETLKKNQIKSKQLWCHDE
jgi:hypothetical protein